MLGSYTRVFTVIVDYGSVFITYGNEIESKGVQFPGEMPLLKINGGG